MKELPELFFKDRKEWRNWLENNYDKSEGIWIIYYKKHTLKSSLSYNEGVEEALCFGWIDSKIQTIDNDKYKQIYTPRNTKSIWSKVNKARAEKMIKEGKMTEAGLRLIEEAKKNGKWEMAYESRQKQDIPEDLLKALQKKKKAYENFMNFASSYQTNYIYWINAAKRDETRKKRIEQVVIFAEQNKKSMML